MKIEKDGNMYCVEADNFVDLAESKDYFFITEEEFVRFKQSELKAFVMGLVDVFSAESQEERLIAKKIFDFYKGFKQE